MWLSGGLSYGLFLSKQPPKHKYNQSSPFLKMHLNLSGKRENLQCRWFYDKKRAIACCKSNNYCRWRYCLFYHLTFFFFIYTLLGLRISQIAHYFGHPLNICPALDTLVEKRVTGFPVVDDDWKLVMLRILYDYIFAL